MTRYLYIGAEVQEGDHTVALLIPCVDDDHDTPIVDFDVGEPNCRCSFSPNGSRYWGDCPMHGDGSGYEEAVRLQGFSPIEDVGEPLGYSELCECCHNEDQMIFVLPKGEA